MIYGIKGFTGFKKLRIFQIIYQGYYVEATVAQKLNQGTIPQSGCYRLRGSFFGYFFGEAKSDKQ